MLICGALQTLPFAIFLDGVAGIAALFQPPMLVILLIAVATFVAPYAAFFRLQQIAGPVYLSQIGSVATIVDSPVAVLALGEQLPRDFELAARLIVLDLAIFQYYSTTQEWKV